MVRYNADILRFTLYDHFNRTAQWIDVLLPAFRVFELSPKMILHQPKNQHVVALGAASLPKELECSTLHQWPFGHAVEDVLVALKRKQITLKISLNYS